MRPRALPIVLAALAAAGCGGGRSTAVRYHDPGVGWTAKVPAGWVAVANGPRFVRGDPFSDPTLLVFRTYPRTTPAGALRLLAARTGIGATSRDGTRGRWRLYRSRSSEIAVAETGRSAQIVALVARPQELDRLRRTVLQPALDSFAPGRPDRPASVLADAPLDPAYWPTRSWRTASPASQRMDAKKLDAMMDEIRTAKLPIDSVTVVRHGYVVLDRELGRFAAGTLAEPYATGHLHELYSVTKSVTSMLAGIARVDVRTPVLQIAAAAHYTPKNLDVRKRAMTVEDLLTMQSGLEWKESGYAYAAGSGSDVVAMTESPNWTEYVIDRPMAAWPGTTWEYDTGAAHLVAGVVSVLTKEPAEQLAVERLFAPLGIHEYRWLRAPEGATSGGFGLALRPRDLAKLAFLYLHHGRWAGRAVVPAAWVERSTAPQAADPAYEYGYLWWLDRADGYAYMDGLYGQLAFVVPGTDLVAVFTAHVPEAQDASMLERWLLERYVLPAAR